MNNSVENKKGLSVGLLMGCGADYSTFVIARHEAISCKHDSDLFFSSASLQFAWDYFAGVRNDDHSKSVIARHEATPKDSAKLISCKKEDRLFFNSFSPHIAWDYFAIARNDDHVGTLAPKERKALTWGVALGVRKKEIGLALRLRLVAEPVEVQ